MSKAYPITVREATPNDAAAIAEMSQLVFRQTFVEEFRIAYDPGDLTEFLDARHGEGFYAACIADPAFGVWVAEVDGALAGHAMAGPMSLPHRDARPDHMELHRLYVRREYHRKGVAEPLMQTALKWMMKRAITMWIGVWEKNWRAISFYNRYGFETVGAYKYPVGRTIDRESIMRRP